MRTLSLCLAGFMLGAALAGPALGQQRIAYIDTEYVLSQMPEYTSIQETLDQLEQEWEQELREQEQAIDELYREYEARELLYTEEERQQMQEEIAQAEREKEQMRETYFGPDGELYQQQRDLMRPIQEQVLEVVEEIALTEGYDYVFDKSGEFLFLFAQDDYDLTDQVLNRLDLEAEEP